MNLKIHCITAVCLWTVLSCSRPQEPCGAKVAGLGDSNDPVERLASIKGLGGLVFYNGSVSLDPNLPYESEHVAARSAFFWFYKDTEAGEDQYRVMIFGRNPLLDDSAQRDHVIAVWVGDGYDTFPVKGLLTKQIQDFATSSTLWSGAEPANLKKVLVSSLFGYSSGYSLRNEVAPDPASRKQWCFETPGQPCLSPDDFRVIIATLDLSSQNQQHRHIGPLSKPSDSNLKSSFENYIVHQKMIRAELPTDIAAEFSDLLQLHKAIYDNSTRQNLLEADLSAQDEKFSKYRDDSVPIIHDCETKTVSSFRTWVSGQSGNASIDYCLPGLDAPKLHLEISMSGANDAKSFGRIERIALLSELMKRLYTFGIKDKSNLYINFNKIGNTDNGGVINDSLSYQSYSFDKFIQPTLSATSIGFQDYPESEAGYFYINYNDKSTHPHTQYPDFNYGLQESSIVTYQQIVPLQALPNRDTLGESGGASVNRLPVSKTSSNSVSASQAPEVTEKDKKSDEITTTNCK